MEKNSFKVEQNNGVPTTYLDFLRIFPHSTILQNVKLFYDIMKKKFSLDSHARLYMCLCLLPFFLKFK